MKVGRVLAREKESWVEMTEGKENLEEELEPFKDLIPSDVEKELKNAINENDGDKIKTLLEGKINPILDSYTAKIKNPELNEGEQILWVHEVTRGIFHKETVEKWTITNLRAMSARAVLSSDQRKPDSAFRLRRPCRL
jgi:hypothetical protein